MKTLGFDTITSSGLPVYVEATFQPPEPDVGIFTEYVDELSVYFQPKRRGKKLYPVPAKLEEQEWDYLAEKAMEARYD